MNKKNILINNRTSDINGTSLIGYVKATFSEIYNVLGEPEGDWDKSTAHWTVEALDGTVATIYDWKEYTTPMGEYRWHIGGKNSKALLLVESLLEKPVLSADAVSWNPYGGGNDQ